MRSSRAFSPAVGDQLESRIALSTYGGFVSSPVFFQNLNHPAIASRAVVSPAPSTFTTSSVRAGFPSFSVTTAAEPVTTPVKYPPGVFSQGGYPTLIHTPTTTLTLKSVTPAAAPTYSMTAFATPAAVTTTTTTNPTPTPVKYPPGVFSQGGYPTLIHTPTTTLTLR